MMSWWPGIKDIQIVQELSRDSACAVYLALVRGAHYSLKVSMDAAGSDGNVARLELLQQGIALARLAHPCLPHVRQVGLVEGVPYVVTDLVDGETLAFRVKRSSFHDEDCMSLARQLLGAVAATHALGLVHGNINTETVVVPLQGGPVRLVDFGMASSRSNSAGSGEPPAPPPELAPGRSVDSSRRDPRIDLCAIGKVLLSARLPTWSEEVFAESGIETLLRQAPERIGASLANTIAKLISTYSSVGYRSATEALVDIGSDGSIGHDVVSPERAPLCGRESQLAELTEYYAETQTNGVRVALVSGVAGSGKTRLVREFLGQSERSKSSVLHAACPGWDPSPFGAIRQLLDNYLAGVRRLTGYRYQLKLAQIQECAGDVSALLASVSVEFRTIFPATPPQPESDDATHIFVEGLARFLSRLVHAEAPAVVWIDDAQWIDSVSRSIVKRAMDMGEETQVLYVLGCRNERENWETLTRLRVGLPARILREVLLSPLSSESALQIMQHQLGECSVDGADFDSVISLSDRTPLGVQQLTTAILDAGALLPHWGQWHLDLSRVARMQLPRSSRELLRRRIAALSDATLHVLSAGAVIGPSFGERVVANVSQLSLPSTRAGLREAESRGLVAARGEEWRFCHATVQEAFLAVLDVQTDRQFNQRAAEALRGSDVDICALARHYARGVTADTPQAAYQANLQAGHHSFAVYDNGQALEFYCNAEAAASFLQSPDLLDLELHRAEAHLRRGDLKLAREGFLALETKVQDRVQLAMVRSRLAWIDALRMDTQRAWQSLESTFEALEVPMPADTPPPEVPPLDGVSGARRALSLQERADLEARCAAYHQVWRLAIEDTRPFRAINAMLQSFHCARQLGPSGELARATTAHAFVAQAQGDRARAQAELEQAQAIAREARDPIALAYTLQASAAILAWAGDIRGALAAGANCLRHHGHWQELNEFGILTQNQAFLEGIRGRHLEAWEWIERLARKVAQHEGTPVIAAVIEPAARAASAVLGGGSDRERLLDRLTELTLPIPKDSGLYVWNAGARLRRYAESGNFGPDFEAIVDEFEAGGHDPKQAHLIVGEYYINLAYARVHMLLRANDSTRAKLLSQLVKAVTDLQGVSRVPMFEMHYLAGKGYLSMFQGDLTSALTLFDEAQSLARELGAPGVHCHVHRGRAHVLLKRGDVAQARDEARMAEALAVEHGAVYRVGFIREEFGLKRPEGYDDATSQDSGKNASPSVNEGTRAERHLHALFQISHATTQELEPTYQARVVVDELLQAVGAKRGFLFLRPRATTRPHRDGLAFAAQLDLIAGRSASGDDLTEAAGPGPEILDDVLLSGRVHRREDVEVGAVDGAREFRNVLAAPLHLRRETIGVIYLDSGFGRPSFSERDGELLAVLANQVPVALELTTALRDRERLMEDLRQSQKMEAVGRLAGGITHDFNNLLAAIRVSADSIAGELADDEHELIDDVNTIQLATEQAGRLTRQLLAFSRKQELEPKLLDVNEMIRELIPVIRRLVGPGVVMDVRPAEGLDLIEVDPGQMEQVLINLAINARDAMNGAGHLTFQTSNILLTDEHCDQNPSLEPGAYVAIAVQDTGHGMDDRTKQLAFEPFFTTKEVSSGTGLGLAAVLGIVHQSGGHIVVDTTPGKGTTFTIYCPRRESSGQNEEQVQRVPLSSERCRAKVLLVDDEPLVRNAMGKALRRAGYELMVAKGAAEALTLLSRDPRAPDLIIVDIVMPGINGVELVQQLLASHPTARFLYISGHADAAIAHGLQHPDSVQFLKKPVTREQLLERVQTLLAPGAKHRSNISGA